MQAVQILLKEIISAIGEHDFTANMAHTLRRFAEFDLAAVLVHQTCSESTILFDNFDAIGSRNGLETYARRTFRLNPMLREVRNKAVRARDYCGWSADISEFLRPYVLRVPEEELGFRTIGWPAHHEEISMYFPATEGIVELGLYRERSRSSAPTHILRTLNQLTDIVGTAFERHQRLAATARQQISRSPLTSRENEIHNLLLAGCSSEAIALRLSLSRHTVKDHRKSIFRKLEVSSLAELFARAR